MLQSQSTGGGLGWVGGRWRHFCWPAFSSATDPRRETEAGSLAVNHSPEPRLSTIDDPWARSATWVVAIFGWPLIITGDSRAPLEVGIVP